MPPSSGAQRYERNEFVRKTSRPLGRRSRAASGIQRAGSAQSEAPNSDRSRNALRSRRRRPSEPLADQESREARSQTPDFRDAVHSRHELDAAFEGLSADHRAALVLHHGADLSISQTAEAMGVAVGTAKSRLNTALRRMRAAMEGVR